MHLIKDMCLQTVIIICRCHSKMAATELVYQGVLFRAKYASKKL